MTGPSKRWVTAILAACLVAGVTAASASATLPEFQTTGKFPVSFTGTSTNGAIFEQTSGGRTLCKTAEISGHIQRYSLQKVHFVFSGEHCAELCYPSGVAAEWLEGELGFVNEHVAGTRLEPLGGIFAKCTSSYGVANTQITGSVVGKLEQVSASKLRLTFNTFSGKQEFIRFLGEEAEHHLTLDFIGLQQLQLGLQTTVEITTAEPVTLRTS